MQTRLLIDGKLTGGEGVAESILDPASGTQIASVPEASREQLEAAVGAAKSADELTELHEKEEALPGAAVSPGINNWSFANAAGLTVRLELGIPVNVPSVAVTVVVSAFSKVVARVFED